MRSALVHAARRLGLEPQLRLLQAELGSRSLRRNRLDDLGLLRLIRTLPADANCIDVGANRGSVLRWFVASAPAGQHIAVEPLPDLAMRLRREFPQVAVHAVALSDCAGQATFYRTEVDTRSSLSSATDAKAFEVTIRRLDDLLPDNYAPSLIKIDVEGAEALVFRGAARTFTHSKPLVVFEHGLAAQGFGTTHRDVYDLLHDCGLRIFDMRGNGPFSPTEFEHADGWNFVAAPRHEFERVRRLGSGLP